MLRFKNGVLLQFENAKDQNAALSITTARQALFYILLGKPGEFAKVAKIEGKQELLKLIMVNLNQFNPAQTKGFNIVEP
jgi:alkyl sulfatase BDS1-like metallo-beta-lactamase superfamily hydrolase